ncbi:hypothetical protein Hanom_Chr06g00574451 [Helianthus anomalus]
MDGVNEPDENGELSNLLDLDAKKQTFGRKSQNWPNLDDENGILLYLIYKNYSYKWTYRTYHDCFCVVCQFFHRIYFLACCIPSNRTRRTNTSFEFFLAE